MSKFDAATAVDPMVYDLTKYGGPQGTIPEPSQGQIETFFKNLKEVNLFVGRTVSEAQKLAKQADESGDTQTLEEFVDTIPEEKIKEYQDQFAGWVHDVTSGTLDVAMLQGLPARIFSAFFRWLSTELSPKDVADDSNL